MCSSDLTAAGVLDAAHAPVDQLVRLGPIRCRPQSHAWCVVDTHHIASTQVELGCAVLCAEHIAQHVAFDVVVEHRLGHATMHDVDVSDGWSPTTESRVMVSAAVSADTTKESVGEI